MEVAVLMWVGVCFLFVYTLLLPTSSIVNTRVIYPRGRRCPDVGTPPSVGVYVPCQGCNEYLEANLRAIAEQDYPSYTVSFVTDCAADPAVPVIEAVLRDSPNARHMVAGYASTLCSQQNFVQAVSMGADDHSDILVKIDSDMRPGPGWLRDFVRPYRDPGVAATTSHHWISPVEPAFVSGCYTVFSGCLAVLMGIPGLQWIWGGCFGIRRSVYHEIDVDDLWRATGTDDSTLRNRLVSRGKRIVFVPDCVAVSHETHDDLGVFVRWISRQAFHGRVYLRNYWLSLLASESVASVYLLLALSVLVSNVVRSRLDAAGVASLVLLATVASSGLLPKLAYPDKKDIPLAWWCALMVPNHFLQCWAAWRTVFMKSLSWRGRVYRFSNDGSVASIARSEIRR